MKKVEKNDKWVLAIGCISKKDNLSAYTLNNLSPDTLKNLSAYTLNNLSADTLKNLSAYTLNNLSADTLKNLSAYILIKNIPKLKKPYTTLLNDIKNKKRIHEQSTFGKIKDFNPELNLCGSPMCTAGHLVNMCGKEGYELRKVFGWEGAASLIHFKAHPNYPCQNFGNISQELALAYIEKMAEFESEGR